jgi:hypothetical protein
MGMNKSIIIVSLGIILITCSACGPSPDTNEQFKDKPVASATIQDPILQQAWLALYNQPEPFPLWKGASLSGRSLAQFILDRRIPIIWDIENICGGSSCSRNHCTKNSCKYIDSEPIYILPAYRQDLQGLQGVLAHEIFHRTQPFGPVHGTRYEEYWAYKIDTHFTRDRWFRFDGYNPLDQTQLAQWFIDNQIHGYYELQYYPPSLVGLAQDQRPSPNLIQMVMNPASGPQK